MNRTTKLTAIVVLVLMGFSGCDEDEKSSAPDGYKWVTHVFTERPMKDYQKGFDTPEEMVKFMRTTNDKIIGTYSFPLLGDTFIHIDRMCDYGWGMHPLVYCQTHVGRMSDTVIFHQHVKRHGFALDMKRYQTERMLVEE